jgi:plasmid stabilization system protein ParE
MAFRVDISKDAEHEAETILNWLLKEQAGETGLRWFAKLYEAIQSLELLPARCGLAPENKSFSSKVRQLVYGRRPHQYRILFTIEGDVVTVLHIRHGRRDALISH